MLLIPEKKSPKSPKRIRFRAGAIESPSDPAEVSNSTARSTEATGKTSGGKKRVFLVDDHGLVRYGASQLIAKETDLEICGEAASVKEALPLIRTARPDVIVADISLKRSNGLEMIKVLRAENSQAAVLVMSMHDELVWADVALRAGAQGYLMKESSIANLVPAIRTVLSGRVYVSPAVTERIVNTQSVANRPAEPLMRLSDRELQVMAAIGQWKTSKQIATELNLSVKTVDYYKQMIKEKLNLASASELVQFAVEAYRRKSTED